MATSSDDWSGFEYGASAPLEMEVAAVMSYSESAELVDTARAFEAVCGDGKDAWSSLSTDEQRATVSACLERLEASDAAVRDQHRQVLLHIATGVGNESGGASVDKVRRNAWCILSEGGLLVLAHTLPLCLDELLEHCAAVHAERAKAEFKEPPDEISADLYMHDDYWVSLRRLRQHLTLLALVVFSRREDRAFGRAACFASCGDAPLIRVLFRLLSSEFAIYLPLKKMLVLTRWLLVAALPPLRAPLGVPVKDGGDIYAHGRQRNKARAENLEGALTSYARTFGPIYVDDHGEFHTFHKLPRAAREGLEILRKNLHEDGVTDDDDDDDDDDDIVDEDERKYGDNDDEDDEDDEDVAARKGKESIGEKLYAALVDVLPDGVGAMLHLLIACCPTTPYQPPMVDLRVELTIGPRLPVKVSDVELSRHRAILLRTVTDVLLRLLKAWRRTDMRQFHTLCAILQQRNFHILALKLLGQKTLGMSCMKLCEVPELTFLAYDGSKITQRETMNELDRAEPLQGLCSFRKCVAYVNLLRVLQKITKHSDIHTDALVRFKAPQIIRHVLKQADHPYFHLYALKLFKRMFKFIPAKWRETSQNMRIVSLVFHHVRMDALDTWMEDVDITKSKHLALVQELKAHREALHAYNQETYYPDEEDERRKRRKRSRFLPALTEDEERRDVFADTANMLNWVVLDDPAHVVGGYGKILQHVLAEVEEEGGLHARSLGDMHFIRGLQLEDE